MLPASEVARVRHWLTSVRLSEEVKDTPQEAPIGEMAERGTAEHEELATGKDSYLQHLAAKEIEAWAEAHSYKVYVEQELYLRRDDLVPYFVGHPDRYVIRDDHALLVIDFKTGPILELDSWADQINSYFALIYEAHGCPSKINLIVISKYHGVFRIIADIADVVTKVIEQIAFLTRHTGDRVQPLPGAWCRYCPARLICPVAEKYHIPLVISGQPLPTGEAGAEVLARLHILKKLVAEKISYYEDLVRFQGPETLANKWVVGKGKRIGQISSLPKAIPLLSQHFIHLIMTASLLEAVGTGSYAKLRDLLAKEKGYSAKDAEEALKDILGELLTFKETKGSIEEAPEQIE